MPRLNLLVVRAREPEKLAAFYSHAGLNFVQHRHGSGPEHLAAENAGTVFEIYPLRPNAEPTRELRFGFEVTDIRQTVAKLVEQGAAIITAPTDSPWGLRAVIKDPEGHSVEFTQPRE